MARLLWQFELNPADHQWARRLVIRSYLTEHKPAEAYRAMLRYQQDFQPLPKEVSVEFVQGLLDEDAVTEANQREANQRSAPAVEGGLFLVPKVIE